MAPVDRARATMAVVDTVEIDTDTIRLGQLLKLAGLVDSGSDAKHLLAGGEVRVNGETESRRGRTIRVGDEVALGDVSLRVVAREGETG
jgi:ribosome-associated protein